MKFGKYVFRDWREYWEICKKARKQNCKTITDFTEFLKKNYHNKMEEV